MTTKYADLGGVGQGVTFTKQNVGFLPIVTRVPSGQAQSGTQVANISCATLGEPTAPLCSLEFPFPGAVASFGQTQDHVQAYVGMFSKPDGSPFIGPGGQPATAAISLTAFDANGTAVAHSPAVTVTSGAGFHTKISVDTPTAVIASVEFDGSQNTLIGLDDLGFNNPATAGAPDFSLSEGQVDQRAPGTLAPGGTLTIPIVIHRLNGSTGPISFSVNGLPTGVTGTFTPTLADISTSLVLTASTDTPAPAAATVTVLGTPADLNAGRTPHPLQVYITIENTFTLRVGLSTATLSCPTTTQGALPTFPRQVSIPITVTRGTSFTGTIDLSVTGLPNNIQASFSPVSLPIGAGNLQDTSILTLNAPARFTLGNTTLVVVVAAHSPTSPISSGSFALRAPPCSPPPFDLVWSQTDPNGFPLNPVWAYQAFSPSGAYPDPALQCPALLSGPRDGVFVGGHLFLGNPPCTSQQPKDDEASGIIAPHICKHGLPPFGYVRPGGGFRGFVNWFPATHVGQVFWSDQSNDQGRDDNDNEMNLFAESNYPFPTLPLVASNGEPTNGNTLHLEFDSDETTDHFDTPWWKKFSDAIHQGKDAADGMVSGHEAVVTGQVALDTVHTITTESHPVYAMAIKETIPTIRQYDATDEGWAIFARNWGNEGYCSQEDWQLQNHPTMSVLIPWMPEATGVEVINSETLLRGHVPRGTAYSVTYTRGEAVVVTVRLGPPSSHPFFDGDLHLKWLMPSLPLRAGTARPALRVIPGVAAMQRLGSPDQMGRSIDALTAKIPANQLGQFRAAAQAQHSGSPDNVILRNPTAVRVAHVLLPSAATGRLPLRATPVHNRQKALVVRLADHAWCSAFNDQVPGLPHGACSSANNSSKLITLVLGGLGLLVILLTAWFLRRHKIWHRT